MKRITTASGAVYLLKSEEGLVMRIGPSDDNALVGRPNNVWNPFREATEPVVGESWGIYWDDSVLGQWSTKVVSIEEVELEGFVPLAELRALNSPTLRAQVARSFADPGPTVPRKPRPDRKPQRKEE